VFLPPRLVIQVQAKHCTRPGIHFHEITIQIKFSPNLSSHLQSGKLGEDEVVHCVQPLTGIGNEKISPAIEQISNIVITIFSNILHFSDKMFYSCHEMCLPHIDQCIFYISIKLKYSMDFL
jgi:hypothetical protein